MSLFSKRTELDYLLGLIRRQAMLWAADTDGESYNVFEVDLWSDLVNNSNFWFPVSWGPDQYRNLLYDIVSCMTERAVDIEYGLSDIPDANDIDKLYSDWINALRDHDTEAAYRAKRSFIMNVSSHVGDCFQLGELESPDMGSKRRFTVKIEPHSIMVLSHGPVVDDLIV